MAGADYAHCDLEPCLKPTGSTKVFYDADTDIPAGTVIMHPECAAKVIAEAKTRGHQRAIEAFQNIRDALNDTLHEDEVVDPIGCLESLLIQMNNALAADAA